MGITLSNGTAELGETVLHKDGTEGTLVRSREDGFVDFECVNPFSDHHTKATLAANPDMLERIFEGHRFCIFCNSVRARLVKYGRDPETHEMKFCCGDASACCKRMQP